jgi:S1-C subfamily serine protease
MRLINISCLRAGVMLWLILLTQTAWAQFNSSGTGFFVSPDGIIMTAKHVVQNKTRVSVLFDGKLYEAKVLKEDAVNDLALISIERNSTPFLRLAKSENIPVGLQVFAIGFPQLNIQGLTPKFSMGIINSDRGLKGSAKHYQFSASIQKGSSGGPLMGPDTLVVGIIESKLGALQGAIGEKNVIDVPQNINFAIKSALTKEIIAGLPTIPKPVSINPKLEKEPYEIFQEAKKSVVPILTIQ